MSEPEKYTLDRVLEVVRGHAEALGNAGKALRATDGNDSEVLVLMGARALQATRDVWEIESVSTPGLDADANEAWRGFRGPLYALPVFALAVEAAHKNPRAALPSVPHGDLPAGSRSDWCHYEARRISKDILEWVREHEKDAEPATATKENGTGTETKSPPEEPQEAEKRAHEADRLNNYSPGSARCPGHRLEAVQRHES